MVLVFSIGQLEYFVKVADHLNCHLAAEAACVSQPGLSSRLKKLECLQELQLFGGTRRSVALTPAGQALLPRAWSTLNLCEESFDFAQSLTRPLSGALRLGVIPTVAPYLLPKVLTKLRGNYPKLKILLREDITHRLLKPQSTGGLDLVLLASDVGPGDVVSSPLFDDPFFVLVPLGHRLANAGRLTESDLAGEQIHLLEDGHCLADQALRICEIGGPSEVGDFRASSLGRLIQVVANGLGIILVPRLAVEGDALDRFPEVIARSIARQRPRRTIALACRRATSRKHEFRSFARALMS